MGGFILVPESVWSDRSPAGFYVGGAGESRLIDHAGNYVANNNPEDAGFVSFVKRGQYIEAFIKPGLLVMMLSSLDGDEPHQMMGK